MLKFFKDHNKLSLLVDDKVLGSAYRAKMDLMSRIYEFSESVFKGVYSVDSGAFKTRVAIGSSYFNNKLFVFTNAGFRSFKIHGSVIHPFTCFDYYGMSEFFSNVSKKGLVD